MIQYFIWADSLKIQPMFKNTLALNWSFTWFQFINGQGQHNRNVSVSSDDDMIDIRTTGTVTERSIHEEDPSSSHCEFLIE